MKPKLVLNGNVLRNVEAGGSKPREGIVRCGSGSAFGKYALVTPKLTFFYDVKWGLL